MSRVVKYANKRFKELISGIKKYRGFAKPEHLHKIRTELKKIKTLFQLIGSGSKQFNATKAYKPLKHIFSKAGHIREMDVLDELYNKYKLTEFKKHNISERKEKKIEKFQKNIDQHIKQIQKSHKHIKKNLANTRKHDLAMYNTEIENQLYSKLLYPLKESELHPIRKQIKKLIYLSQIMDEENIPQIKNYDKLQEIIGRWHDKNFLIEILEKNKTPTIAVKKLKSQCKKDLKLIGLMADKIYMTKFKKVIN